MLKVNFNLFQLIVLKRILFLKKKKKQIEKGLSLLEKWKRRELNPLDLMFEDSTSKCKLFCGDIQAARDLNILKRHEIGFVVNCQGILSENYFEGDEEENINYHRFPVALFGNAIKAQPLSAYNYFHPHLIKIDEALADGRNVLIHCAAGAHRAATVTAAFLLWRRHVSFEQLETYMTDRRYQVELHCFKKLFEALELFQKQLEIFGEIEEQRKLKQQQKQHKASDFPFDDDDDDDNGDIVDDNVDKK